MYKGVDERFTDGCVYVSGIDSLELVIQLKWYLKVGGEFHQNLAIKLEEIACPSAIGRDAFDPAIYIAMVFLIIQVVVREALPNIHQSTEHQKACYGEFVVTAISVPTRAPQ